jgi:hypothetical protein
VEEDGKVVLIAISTAVVVSSSDNGSEGITLRNLIKVSLFRRGSSRLLCILPHNFGSTLGIVYVWNHDNALIARGAYH